MPIIIILIIIITPTPTTTTTTTTIYFLIIKTYLRDDGRCFSRSFLFKKRGKVVLSFN
jgi:hypothetical protein